MTVQINKEGWLAPYIEMREPRGGLQRFFTPKRGAFFEGTKVAIDVKRMGEPVATVVKACTGVNFNDVNVFTTKEFTPPAYGEGFVLTACELLNRQFGVDPYTAAYIDSAADIGAKMLEGFTVIDAMISRGVELQAAQILQTGKLTLLDAAGDTKYELDFLPKNSHFPTTSTSWSNLSGSDPIADLEGLCDEIRSNGKAQPRTSIFGKTALNNFLNNDKVKSRADVRRYNLVDIDPAGSFTDSGMLFYGKVMVGSYDLEIWTYPETYDDPQSGDPTTYIDADKVVILGDGIRLDMVSASVPRILSPDPRVAGLIPPRLSSRELGFDVWPNVYASEDGKNLKAELESRPLLVPVQIDGFGCLDTQI